MIATIGLTGYRAFSSSGTTTTIKASDRRRIWKEKNVSMLKWYANDMQ